MTDTTPETSAPATPRRSGSLSSLRLAELQALASSMGLSGTTKMRKSDLIEAIRARQSGAGVSTQAPERAAAPAAEAALRAEQPAPQQQTTQQPAEQPAADDDCPRRRPGRSARRGR